MELDENYARLRGQADAALKSGAADAPQATADAVRWCRAHLSSEDPELAWALVRQAHAAAAAGQMVEVGGRTSYLLVPLFEEALTILRKSFGSYSEPIAAVLSSYATCLGARDQIAALTPLRERLTVLWNLPVPSHPDVGVAAYTLAQTLSQCAQKLREESEAQFRTSLDVWARQPPSPWASMAWSGLGYLAETTGDLAAAEHAYRQAVQANKMLPTEPGLDLVMHLLAVARIAVRRGAPNTAVPLLEEALAKQRALLGDANLDVAATWFSICLASNGTRALKASREALHAAGAWLETCSVTGLASQQPANVLATLTGYADWHLAHLLTTGSGAAEMAEVAAWRHRLPDLLLRPWRLTAAPHPDERELSALLSEIATRHQERYQTAHIDNPAGIAGKTYVEHGLRLRQLRARRAALEARLRSEAFVGRVARPLASGALDAARRTLASDERFVTIVRVGGRYAAIVVGPGDKQTTLIDLGQVARIDLAAQRARASFEGPGRAAFRDVGPLPEPGTGRPDELTRLVVEPLLEHIAGCRRLRMSLDGQLLHVPFGVLAAGSAPLLASCAVDYVTGIDGPTVSGHTSVEPGPDVILAAPDYDLGRTGPANPDSLFRPLAGTEQEALAIARPGTIVLTRELALKSRLRGIRSPRVLHFATHGYTLADAEPDELQSTDRLLGNSDSTLGGRYWNLSREPDLRSGLALAGANTWLEHGDPGLAAGTGLLTVADVIGLELAGTELVVLSACDTGIGEINAVEGHMSLRAAFLRAGAKAVVASLWKVPDEPTRDLMVRLYELLDRGLGPADALRDVQLEFHAAGEPVLNWGAFVCYVSGEDSAFR